jgi:hypothetical protein
MLLFAYFKEGIYMSEEYSPDTLERIWADVQHKQQYSIDSDCKITHEDLSRAMEAIEAHPYGDITIYSYNNVGCGLTQMRLSIYWYSWCHKKYVNWGIQHVKDVNSPQKSITAEYSKERSWFFVFPERYKRYHNLRLIWQLSHLGYIVPKDAEDIDLIEEKGGMAVIFCSRPQYPGNYLCSPAGYIYLGFFVNGVDDAAEKAGIELPNNAENCIWEDVEPAWAMAQLRRL